MGAYLQGCIVLYSFVNLGRFLVENMSQGVTARITTACSEIRFRPLL